PALPPRRSSVLVPERKKPLTLITSGASSCVLGRSMVRWLSCISCGVAADAPGDRLYLTLGQRVPDGHVQPCQVVGYVLFIRSGTARPDCNGGHRHVALPLGNRRDLPRQRHLGGGAASWCPCRWHEPGQQPPRQG